MTEVLHGEHKLRWVFSVIVTPNPCPRHVCLMSVTKEILVNCRKTRKLLMGKNFDNEGFYLNTLQVTCTVFHR